VLVEKRISVTLEIRRDGSLQLFLWAGNKDNCENDARFVLRVQHHYCSTIANGVSVHEAVLCATAVEGARRVLMLLEELRLCNTRAGVAPIEARSCPNSDVEGVVLSGLVQKGFLGSAGCTCMQQEYPLSFKPCIACTRIATAEDIAAWMQLGDAIVGQGHGGWACKTSAPKPCSPPLFERFRKTRRSRITGLRLEVNLSPMYFIERERQHNC